MTRNQLIEYVRWILDTYDQVWLRDTDASRYSIADALMDGYNQYAMETDCFKVSYTTGAVSGTSEYALTDFGSGAARIYKITLIAYGTTALIPELENQVSPTWQWNACDTPVSWVPWGANKFRLNPTPASTGTITLQGFETPDSTTFDASGDTPNIHAVDHTLIGDWAAMQIITRNPNAANAVKLGPIQERWRRGVIEAKRRYSRLTMVDVRAGSQLGIQDTGLSSTSVVP